MRAKRIDENQTNLVNELRKLPGVTVSHTHTLGKGFPDIVVGHNGVNYLFEIKNPSKPKSQKRLTPDEVQWHETWTGQVSIIETVYDVINIIYGKEV